MQDFAAITIVVFASAYLARVAWQTLVRRQSGCSSCAGCSSAKSPPVVQIKVGRGR